MITPRDFFVDREPRKAESLPASAFTNPEFLELELNTIFRRTWTLVPTQRGMEKTGSRVPFELLGQPMFLTRNSKNELNCFPNVCTHAWHPLVQTASVGGSIVCPQHGREFDTDGRFKAHKGFENLQNFPRESDNLRKLHLEVWGPFTALCLGDPLAPFHKFAGSVKESIPGIKLETLRYRPVPNEAREVEGNWKQQAWNYMDNYHIRFVHKGPEGLSDAIDLNSYRTELYEYSSLQWAYARNPDHGFRSEQVSSRFRDPKHPEKRVFALWWFLFPNIALNFYPWGVSVNQYLPIPGRPEKTEFHWYQYALDEEKFKDREKFWLSEQVDAEDIEAIRLVSRGAKSGFAPRGRFAPKEEAGPHWLHRLIYTTVFDDHC
jgi:choline monooxygenase